MDDATTSISGIDAAILVIEIAQPYVCLTRSLYDKITCNSIRTPANFKIKGVPIPSFTDTSKTKYKPMHMYLLISILIVQY